MAVREPDTAAGPDAPRDPALDRAYAAGARVEPPAHLDAAILAAARREVHAGPRRPGSIFHRWRAPFALAAVLVLSVSVVLLLREEGADRLAESPASIPPPLAAPAGVEPAAPTSPQPNAQRPAQLTPQPKEPPTDGADRLRDAPASQAAPAEEDRRRKAQAAAESRLEAPRSPESPRPAARPFAEAPASPAEPKQTTPGAPSQADALAKRSESAPAAAGQAKERAEREQEAPQRPPSPPAIASDAPVGSVAPPARTMARSAASGAASRDQDRQRNDAAGPRTVWQGYESQPPEKWLERVEELRRAGREADAREMLAEFRKRFPQHPVPATLER